MKFNFYPAVFLLITIVPILIIRPQSQEAGIAEFVRSKHNVGERDTIKLYALESGLETEYKEFDFSRNVVKFIEDTLYMRFNTVGYNILLDIKGQHYTAHFITSDCIQRKKLRIRKQHLIFEDFQLIHNGTLKGEYYCEAVNPSFYSRQSNKLKICGYFEMPLVDHEQRLRESKKQMVE